MKALLVATMIASPLSGLCAERSNDDAAYYRQWIGCKPPPLNFDRSDRTNYVETLCRGEQVLLYSFDAGDFVNLPNEHRLTAELQSLHRARTNLARPFGVIGYTRGILWNPVFGMKEIPKQIEEASRFPIINLNNKHGENALPEPYRLLESPRGILIDTNGIICFIWSEKMTEKDFQCVSTIPPWVGAQRKPPDRKADENK